MENRKDFLKTIKNNISRYGYHINSVISDSEPHYTYTIGLHQSLGFELIFAGGIIYMQNEVFEIFGQIVESLKIDQNQRMIEVNNYGFFELKNIHHTWTKLMALGIYDYYKTENVLALQIIPDSKHITLDVPDMSEEFNVLSQPVWKFLSRNWDYPVKISSTAVTDIQFLKGEKITEVTRWEDDEWEAFTGNGNEIDEKKVRVISVATMIAIYPTLEIILSLDVGKGLWRDKDDLIWQEWN